MTRTLSQCAANTAQQTSDILIKVILNIYKIITLVININDKLLKYNQFYHKNSTLINLKNTSRKDS